LFSLPSARRQIGGHKINNNIIPAPPKNSIPFTESEYTPLKQSSSGNMEEYTDEVTIINEAENGQPNPITNDDYSRVPLQSLPSHHNDNNRNHNRNNMSQITEASEYSMQYSKFLLMIMSIALTLSFAAVAVNRHVSHKNHSNNNSMGKSNPDGGGGDDIEKPTLSPPSNTAHNQDPWNIDGGYGGIFSPPIVGIANGDAGTNSSSSSSSVVNVGYLSQPHVHNNTLVFVSEGDLYVTSLRGYDGTGALSAMRTTVTAGNIITPKIAPCGYLVAYTATYTGVRELYVVDLRGNAPAQRITYIDSAYGAMHVIQWNGNDEVIFSAYNTESAMEDSRLYRVKISGAEVGKITPVPLAQVTDAAFLQEDGVDCMYFVRYKQSSNTIRYVGGTAENIWHYCENQNTTTKISGEYHGTSRAPQILTSGGDRFLLFLSDRSDGSEDPVPVITNLFAMPVGDQNKIIKLTNVCGGIGVAELAADSVTGNVILRVGADLYFLPSGVIDGSVQGSGLKNIADMNPMSIKVHSDFNALQERVIRVNLSRHLSAFDCIKAPSGQVQTLLTLRGQLHQSPLVMPPVSPYQVRRLKLAPGSKMEGITRVLWSAYFDSKVALVLATDPSNQASHAWYLIDTSVPSFTSTGELPVPIVTNITSVYTDRIAYTAGKVAWVDTDLNVCLLDLTKGGDYSHIIMPKVNDQGNPVVEVGDIMFHSSGELLAVEHNAANQFSVISVAAVAETADASAITFVQATSDKFNSNKMYLTEKMLYFFSDRDVMTDVGSPWGTRAPMPHLRSSSAVYGLPLAKDSEPMIHIPENNIPEVSEEGASNSENTSDTEVTEPPPLELSLVNLISKSYRLEYIPAGRYYSILCAGANYLTVLDMNTEKVQIIVWVDDGPSNMPKEVPLVAVDSLESIGFSANNQYFYLVMEGKLLVVENNLEGLLSLKEGDVKEVFTEGMALHVQPQLEYLSMYEDAWRLLRDYFYDKNMHGVDWSAVYKRYLPLVSRCAKREELDDILKYMASELSALHVFVYGGEYTNPAPYLDGSAPLHQVASLGATFNRTNAGYAVTNIFIPDPDFDHVDGNPISSPLSSWTLRLTGQAGLVAGDVITHINGENVLSVPDLGYLLRGVAGQSVQITVQRAASNAPDSVIAVPINQNHAADLRYRAWEYSTRMKAKKLAADRGFTLGYIHLRDMGTSAENAFTRQFYPDYNGQVLIVDVRHNHGGNIDSWLLDALQRKAWGYWQGRATNVTNGGLGWDEQFSFRGHIVVLIDEKTSSDGEGFSRGMKALGLAKLVGTRTWGGGIWLSSDNHLVDGGIATAPEIGTYNNKWGWGLGIEQMGVEPDVEVDNDPHKAFLGEDKQLEKAIEILSQMLKDDPVKLPENPGPHPNKSISSFGDGCPA